MYKLTSFGMALVAGVLLGLSGCGTAVSQDAASRPTAAKVSRPLGLEHAAARLAGDMQAPSSTADAVQPSQPPFAETLNADDGDDELGVIAEAVRGPKDETSKTQDGKPKPKPQDTGPLHARTSRMVKEAAALIEKGQSQRAINEFLDPVIQQFRIHYQREPRKIYCARTLTEAQVYLLTEVESTFDQDVVVLQSTWADAYFLKGYALIELGNADEAIRALDQALVMSPSSSAYLSERGHLYQIVKDWKNAQRLFEKAMAGAEHAPPSTAQSERARALRGVGFTLVELGQLEQAEEKFRECLRLNPTDQKAKGELMYIEQLRRQNRTGRQPVTGAGRGAPSFQA